jgi:hypothetical protein
MAKETKEQPTAQLPPVEEAKPVENDDAKLIRQIEAEYQVAYKFMQPKFTEWAMRLKLYNNQKRDKTAVGDPLLFTIHQTILASLYEDRLSVDFLGREEGDEETAENLVSLANFDYDEMEKDILDYEWDWDASFFGRGLCLEMEYDRNLKCPQPEIIDMMTWLRDPRATSVNGDRKGRGAMKFGGREIRLSKDDMREAGIYTNFDDLKIDANDVNSVMDKNIQARKEAQGYDDITKFMDDFGDNGTFRCLEWFTIYKGKKILVTLANNRKTIIRRTELGKTFPIIDRTIYPIAHDWDGVSVPDLVEDKQRARAVVENLGIKGIKVGLNPTYLFNTNKIQNRGNLNVAFNKHIPVDGDPTNSVVALQRQAVKSEVSWIMEVLDTAAQKATATPDIQQGASSEEKRTATELNLISAKVDTRYSLSAKIFGWSEKRFWRQWYDLYKDHFEEGIDEKVIRLVGSMGSKWRTLTRENIVAHTDPDIKIESKVVSEAKKFNELQKFRLWLKDILATDPKNSNIRFALKKIGRLSGFTKEVIDQILPPTIDEMNAEKENDMLNSGKRADVMVYDDDFIHMEIHNKVKDSPVKTAHINAHRNAMMLKRMKPEFDIAKNRPAEAVEEAQVIPEFSGMNTGGAQKRALPVAQ